MKRRATLPSYFERMYLFLWGYVCLLLIVGTCLGGPSTILPGLAKIVLTEDALITDYVLVAGIGPIPPLLPQLQFSCFRDPKRLPTA